MPSGSPAEAFVPLKPVVLHILLALAERPLHGYGIIRSVRERTGGTLTVHTGPLYRQLRRLLDEELVAETEGVPEHAEDDARRGSYYRLSPLGREVLSVELRRMRQVIETGRDLGIV